jgi:four helix bundle suffix protein
MSTGFIPDHGGYQSLLSYQRAVVVYDATVAFCRDFFEKRDRTVDQMVQAARSGKQNIVEGSMASGTSKETELKLTNVARASLEELLEDYRDFLRTRRAAEWDKDSKEALYVRRLARGLAKNRTHATHATDGTDLDSSRVSRSSPVSRSLSPSSVVTYETFRLFEDRPAEVRANICISLIRQTNYLLDQQIRRLERDFLREGGLRERMTRARIEAREQQRTNPR